MTRPETTPEPTRARRSARPEREGSVMIVVMLVLLTVTALAVYSVQATTYELRAAGHARQAMQAQYVGEAGLVAALAMMDDPTWGPNGFLHSVEMTEQSGTLSKPVMAPFEPELLADKWAYRMFSEDLDLVTLAAVDPLAAPVHRAGLGANDGMSQTHDPLFYVDIHDHYTWTGILPGHRSDGGGRLHHLRATYTARGRLRLRGGDYVDPTGIDGTAREFHELASDARAQGISGPFAR